jgi:hypothetical protein
LTNPGGEVINRDMNKVIEPVSFEGISTADLESVGDELGSYHSLYTPFLSGGSNERKVSSILKG